MYILRLVASPPARERLLPAPAAAAPPDVAPTRREAEMCARTRGSLVVFSGRLGVLWVVFWVPLGFHSFGFLAFGCSFPATFLRYPVVSLSIP